MQLLLNHNRLAQVYLVNNLPPSKDQEEVCLEQHRPLSPNRLRYLVHQQQQQLLVVVVVCLGRLVCLDQLPPLSNKIHLGLGDCLGQQPHRQLQGQLGAYSEVSS